MKKTFLLKTMLLLCALIVGMSSAWGQVTIWSENFSGYSADDIPEGTILLPHTGTSLNASSGLTYACTNGTYTQSGKEKTAYTKIYNENSAGGSAPELLVARTTGGSFTATIPLDNIEGTLTLSYYQNAKKLKVSSTTTGVSGGQELKPSTAGQQTTTFTGITSSMTSITIKFETTTSDNVRLDNIVLTGYKATSVTAPTFSNTGGEVAYGTQVTVSNYNDDYLYFFTTDNTDPDCDSNLDPVGTSQTYDDNINGITITDDVTLKMIAVDVEGNKSAVTFANYTLIRPDSPTMNPNGGIVGPGSTVTLEQDDATLIMYTLNGADPSFANSVGTEYTEPITINTTTTIKAIAVDNNGVESAIKEATFYVIEGENDFSWNLATNSYVSNPAPTADLIQWSNSYVTMKNEKGSSSTGVNNYIPTAQSSTRFYAKNELTITPASGVEIKAIVFTATTDGYATALANSSWTNASAGASEKTVIIVPTFGTSPVTAVIGATTGHNNVKIYFNELPSNVTITPAKAVTTYVTTCNLDFEGIAGLDAFVATAAANGVVTLAEVGAVPAGTPLLLRGTASTPYTVPVVGPATAPTTNLLKAGDGVTPVGGSNAYDYVLSDGKWYRIGPDPSAVSVSKAYLHCDKDPLAGGAPELSMDWGEGTTAIQSIERTINDNQYYTLDGRRVAEPTKGLYIINGKKVVIK